MIAHRMCHVLATDVVHLRAAVEMINVVLPNTALYHQAYACRGLTALMTTIAKMASGVTKIDASPLFAKKITIAAVN